MHQYLHEMRTCLKLGANYSTRARLAAATLQFHLSNFMNWDQRRADTAVVNYRVELENGKTDFWLRPRTGDFFILHEIFTNTCYRLPEALVERAATIMDLGANIGMTTLFFSQYFPDAKYICVEPNPANTAVLRRNLSSLGDRAEVIEAAISDSSGQSTFDDSGWSWGGHLIDNADSGRPIRCCTVDQILAESRVGTIDLLKVDVEGAERRIFRNTPAWLARVRCMIVELHDGYSLSDFERDVFPAGFTIVPAGSAYGNSMVMAVSNREALNS